MAKGTIQKEPLPYYHFREDSAKIYLEGRFWNQGGRQIAIVAVVTKDIDWAAYIGTDAPDSYHEQDTLDYVANKGCKLRSEDAKYFFPKIDLPYRY